ncbi:hypothetical protein [Streptosporangium sp. NPDC002721]|uniref:hypothetical protein n=1 Tax=Streptosporangium sp. NPDC002721 TaxID=3366188 RepID=UPI003677B874
MNSYWKSHWSEFFPGRYFPPRILGGYDFGRPGAPTCQGWRIPDDDAVYCPFPADFITWDVDLMRAGYRQGDAWVYLIIAHEWGHAVQARMPGRHVAVAAELQADCLAGAALQGAVEDGLLDVEEGDADEIRAGLHAVGGTVPWTRPGDHGSKQERMSAFHRGANRGVPGCLRR